MDDDLVASDSILRNSHNAGRPWVPLYVADFLADTYCLSAAETGAYVFLVLRYLQDGRLPKEDRELRRIAKMSGKAWLRSKGAIAELFDEDWKPNLRNFTFRERRVGHGWAATRKTVFKRDGFVCVYCGCDQGPFECDHVFPVSRGGTDDLSNLATACRPCNRSKKDKTPAEWLQ